ncbi:MAG TPA: c-type cytochrome [Mycobacteriales bacterium]|nr:c-type cytochrome [Mycobacteriales bacterium]
MADRGSSADARRWADLGAARPGRWRRRLAIAGGALATVAVVLVGTVALGARLGANEVKLPGQKRAVGGTGRVLYLNNCAQCHGPAGEGGPRVGAPAFTPGGALHGLTFEERVAKISRGKPLRGMPAWKFQISDDDIRKIAAYTQILSGAEPDPSVQGVR